MAADTATTTESIVLAGGCFWCTEASYQLIEGVISALPGYAGGSAAEADYDTVAEGRTAHAECVKVVFDPNVISLADILDIFWAIHDPTTPDRQGNDVGSQYRSAIFYANETQHEVVQQSVAAAQKLWDDPIVTEVAPLEAFYPAEDYHHNYFLSHPEQAYCQIVINPKLAKLRQKFAERIKKS